MKSNFAFLEGDSTESMPMKMLWNSSLPSKLSVFGWELWWGKILTLVPLKFRGFSMASMCPLRRNAEETVDHLCIHCPKIWKMWIALVSVAGGI